MGPENWTQSWPPKAIKSAAHSACCRCSLGASTAPCFCSRYLLGFRPVWPSGSLRRRTPHLAWFLMVQLDRNQLMVWEMKFGHDFYLIQILRKALAHSCPRQAQHLFQPFVCLTICGIYHLRHSGVCQFQHSSCGFGEADRSHSMKPANLYQNCFLVHPIDFSRSPFSQQHCSTCLLLSECSRCRDSPVILWSHLRSQSFWRIGSYSC